VNDNDPNKLTKAVVDADLGVGGRRLVVISGIASPAWVINWDSVADRDCRLRLRHPVDNVEQATIHVGLAHVANNDTEYVFATDKHRWEIEAGELVLITHIVLSGSSGLIRFSYQIVLTTRVVVSEISGTITWPTEWFRPASPTPTAVADTFTVMANERTTETIPPSEEEPFGRFIEHLTPKAPGEIVSVEIGDLQCRARYRISNPPKERELKVTVGQQGLRGPGQTTDVVPVVEGGNLIRLTVAQPTRDGVDFNARSDVIR